MSTGGISSLDGAREPATLLQARTRIAELGAALSASEARVERLRKELQSRGSNILAIVRLINRRSLEQASSLEDLKIHQSGRLDALARVENMLVRTEGRGGDLEDVLWSELTQVVSPNEETRLDIDGPAVLLAPRIAERLARAFHELTINALKFGALALGHSDARVAVRWSAMQGLGPRLQIVWAETGVPVMNIAPQWTGFGREFLERGLTYDLEAETRLEFLPGGLRCQILLPLNPGAVVSISGRRLAASD